VNAMRGVWRKPDNGIWEIRSGVRHHVHSKLMSWVAFERAQQLAPLFGGAPEQKQWAAESAELRGALERGGLGASGSHVVSAYGGKDLDATLLLLPIHGFLPVDDPRIVRTIERVREALGSSPYLYRYDGDGRWTCTGQLDATPEVKYRRAWSTAVYDGKLYFGTLPAGGVMSLEAGRSATLDSALAPGWRQSLGSIAAA